MPRGKRRNTASNVSRASSEDDEDTADNLSTISALSDDICSITEEGAENSDVDDTTSQQKLEDKLLDCLDLTSVKSAKSRQECLQEIHRALRKRYLFDFLDTRKDTLANSLALCVKKGKGDEVSLACKCMALFCVQMGKDADQAFLLLRPLMLTLLLDKSVDCKTRSHCATSLAICSLASPTDISDIVSLMDSLETIFRSAYKKGDGSTPSHSPELNDLHSSALSAWSLLLSMTPAYITQKIVTRCLPKLPDILCSSYVDLRIMAGETIALMYELAREQNEDFRTGNAELYQTLKELATDSVKHRAKKDRRHQRSSFRDILRYIEDCEISICEVKFGRERITLHSWVSKCQYNALCNVLGPGMNLHLKENMLIRNIFSLGPSLATETITKHKSNKLERTLHNAALSKARTQTRNKQRDKRSVVMNNGY